MADHSENVWDVHCLDGEHITFQRACSPGSWINRRMAINLAVWLLRQAGCGPQELDEAFRQCAQGDALSHGWRPDLPENPDAPTYPMLRRR